MAKRYFPFERGPAAAAIIMLATAAWSAPALAQFGGGGGGFGGGGGGGGGGFGGGGGGHGGGGGGGGPGPSTQVTDPGVRGGAAGAGGPIGGLNTAQQAFFTAAQARFSVTETVSAGLGPGFNELSCSNCHISPAVGGSSPATNPQVTDANVMGAKNVIPSFITANGPIREARFVRNPDGTPDGGVHDLFSIQGRSDAPGCVFAQPNFAAQLAKNNVIFRIPINTFGDGLVEGVSDLTLQNAVSAQASRNGSLGISGTFNRNGNTGNIARFGWKAQNASLMLFAGEAYNVEEGVTNEIFPNKRNMSVTPNQTVPASAQCAPNPLPEDTSTTVDQFSPASASLPSDLMSDIVNFSMFMRLLAAPTPAVPFTPSSTASTASTASTSTSTAASSSTTASTTQVASILPTAAGTSTTSTSSSSSSTPSAASVQAGFQAFNNVGCSGCHVVSQTVGSVTFIDVTANTAVSNTTINPFSDYAVHNMGTGLADGVSQGTANGNQFRTAPLWGVGQRVFFLHDGRTNNLLTAIQQHASSGSEANQVIQNFNMLSPTQQQNIINFLRDL
jgi:CxxC motif-containing protein (DUF1111 family)